MQLVFLWWTRMIEGITQANALCMVTLVLIVLDTKMDICAALEAYYIQDKFVPVNLLKMDDKLKDAEGVFGEVRHGKYLGTDVAVKRSKPEMKKERPEIYKAFLNEARILGELGNHPNIVKLVGISPMLSDEFYIVMEYCEGGSALNYLSKLRRQESYEAWLKTVVAFCMEVCDAMHYMHEKGYTHRDITASNIFVKGGRAMLGDLGLARDLGDEEVFEDYNESGDEFSCMPKHHSLYAPPELRDPALKGKYTTGCDVYCFGIAIWEMLMLRSWTLQDASRGPAAALAQLTHVPPFFAMIISRCWHEEDCFRPTFAEVLEEFVRFNREKWSPYRVAAPPLPVPEQVSRSMRRFSPM